MAQWIEGTIVRQLGINGVTLSPVDMVTSFVGYYGEPNGSAPVAGVPYFCRIGVAVDNPGTGYVAVETGLFLPPNTQIYSPPSITWYLSKPPPTRLGQRHQRSRR